MDARGHAFLVPHPWTHNIFNSSTHICFCWTMHGQCSGAIYFEMYVYIGHTTPSLITWMPYMLTLAICHEEVRAIYAAGISFPHVPSPDSFATARDQHIQPTIILRSRGRAARITSWVEGRRSRGTYRYRNLGTLENTLKCLECNMIWSNARNCSNISQIYRI